MTTGLTRRAFLGGAAAVGAGACAHQELAGPFPKAARVVPPNYVVDVHCHVFNGSDLPIAGFVEKIYSLPPELADPILRELHDLIDKYAPTGAQEIAALQSGPPPSSATSADLRQELRARAQQVLDDLVLSTATWYGGSDLGSVLERFIETVDLVAHYRYEIAAKLAKTYPTVDLFTPAMVDYDGWANADLPKTPIAAQIMAQKAVSQLAMRGALPGAQAVRVHPLVPFNPLREANLIKSTASYDPFATGHPFTAADGYACASGAPPADGSAPPAANAGALALVRYAVEQAGFVGIKVYPPVGFHPLDNATLGPQPPDAGQRLDLALRALYAYAEAEQAPIMSHTGKSNGFAPGYGMFAAPDNWRPVLAAYPKLRLNLAHFGELEGTDNDRGPKACEAWIRQVAALMRAYPNVYADLGCSSLPVYKDWADRYMDVLGAIVEEFPVVAKRLMFGTDFWLNGLYPNAQFFVDAFTDALEKAFGTDVRHDIMGGNALRFYGFRDDAGHPAATRPAARLRAFYGASPRPAWLG